MRNNNQTNREKTGKSTSETSTTMSPSHAITDTSTTMIINR
jgi:hypothetical protein